MAPVLESLGMVGVPLLVSFGLVVLLTLWAAWRLFRPRAAADPRSRIIVDAVLFWGLLAAVVGGIGALLGVVQLFQAFEAAGGVAVTPAAAGALRTATLSPLSGLLVLAFAALFWFVLQLRWRLLWAAAEDEVHIRGGRA